MQSTSPDSSGHTAGMGARFKVLPVERQGPLTYEAVGSSLSDQLPHGFRHVHVRELVSSEPSDLDRLGDALMSWQMHARCLKVQASGGVEVGATVSLRPSALPGVAADCMVVAVVDEPERTGFAYGTLARHPECGEEAFILERSAVGVHLSITAFSRPHTRIARLSGPVGRAVQTHFTRRYVDAMRKISAG